MLGQSTHHLQVLVSIQGLVLVAKPYYNEVWCPVTHFGAQAQEEHNMHRKPSSICELLCMCNFQAGFERQSGSAEGLKNALLYNENAMLVDIRRQVHVVSHFINRMQSCQSDG